MFVDKAKISIKAGDGGNGAISFHREKYVSRGGPDGGDGGRGGSVYFEATRNAHTLESFKHNNKYQADRGDDGGKNNRYGKDGDDITIRVPAGTVIRDAESGEVLLDMFEDNTKKILLRGGRGGRGNAKFATPTRQAPRFSTPGQQARAKSVILELRTIADVGLIGMPNVGKSSLLALLTSARPKIANYHFTTLAPNLGVVKIDGDGFVMADIPGLIEGASSGAGLGHDFLRHVQRTRVLLHIIDASGLEGRDPVDDYKKIMAELAAFDENLAKLPQIVAANKMDLLEAREDFDRIKKELEEFDAEVYPISVATNEGIQEMLRAVASKLRELPELMPFDEIGELPQEDTSVYQILENDGVFVIDGPLAEYLMRKANIDDIDSLRHLHITLKKRGVIQALKDAGAQDGDIVEIFGWEFEFQDS